MGEDWRVTVNLPEQQHAGRLLTLLRGHEVEDDVRDRLGKRVSVGGGNGEIFLYADTEAAAHEAQQVVEQLLPEHKMTGTFTIDRWHHDEERWEDASVPLPANAEAVGTEHERQEQDETAESQETGLAEWEVRIELASHQDAQALAERLEGEGYHQLVRRWKYLLIGTDDRDGADALAARLQNELPEGATIEVEPGSGLAWELMPQNPFAVFGGLGG